MAETYMLPRLCSGLLRRIYKCVEVFDTSEWRGAMALTAFLFGDALRWLSGTRNVQKNQKITFQNVGP